MTASGVIVGGAILGLDCSTWAKSPGLSISVEEARGLVVGFSKVRTEGRTYDSWLIDIGIMF
jgi:hypothetical protein